MPFQGLQISYLNAHLIKTSLVTMNLCCCYFSAFVITVLDSRRFMLLCFDPKQLLRVLFFFLIWWNLFGKHSLFLFKTPVCNASYCMPLTLPKLKFSIIINYFFRISGKIYIIKTILWLLACKETAQYGKFIWGREFV